jgi:hypothetical protein
VPLRSLLERSAPPPDEAQRQLDALHGQARDLGLAGAFSVAGAGVALALERPLVPAFATGVAATVALGLRCRGRRRRLLEALMRERDAYTIEAVARDGARFAAAPRRRRLAQWLRRLVQVADGERVPASFNVRVIDGRVLSRRERLLALADALDDAERPIHPASVALLHQMLTRPGTSPLYNPGLDADLLDLALHRIEAGIEPPPVSPP